MTKKIFTILLAIIVLGVVGIGTAEAAKWITSPEDGLFWKAKAGEARVPTVQEVLTAEVEAIASQKEEDHQKKLLEAERAPSPSDQVTQSPLLGVKDASEVPAPFSSREFKVINYWGGEVAGKSTGVYAGYRPQNPSQGVLAVTDGKENAQGTFYPTPTSTGPVRVSSEENGVLMLESVRGTFEVYDENVSPPKSIQTSGQKIYVFDLITKSFREAVTIE